MILDILLPLTLLGLASSANTLIVGDVNDLPYDEYDFIVVGGGTAGLTVANRLTENPRISVLVLEAGPSNEDVIRSIVPFYGPLLLAPDSPYDWNYTTVPQAALNDRSIPYPRGHILGGSSSTNFLAYLRGSSSDWDRYAALTEDEGWSWDKIQPFIRKNERWSPPADLHDVDGQYDPTIHSTTGVVSVSLAGHHQSIDDRVIQATQELSDKYPFNLDMNSGNPIGIGWIQSTVGGGKRSSSATAYLGPGYIHRPNLHVLIGARVIRLVETSCCPRDPQIRTAESAVCRP